MTILGIETSCDETSVAIVNGDKNQLSLLANVTATSLDLHAKTGGIIPEIAAREQLAYMLPTLEQAVKVWQGQKDIPLMKALSSIDAIAVTYGPGLIGSLLVGVETAKTLSMVLQKPIIPVNHMLGHIYANFIDPSLRTKRGNPLLKSDIVGDCFVPRNDDIQFPAIVLVVSGGHTDLLLLKNHKDLQLLGGTRDDAAGECFDKCARLLGYPYPGGPKISELALQGDPKAFPFPRPMIGSGDYEFSFSGLKTAFLNTTLKLFPTLRTTIPNSKAGWQQIVLEKQLAENEKQKLYDLCASLQKAIVDVLVKKTMKAAQQYNTKSILISGGVAANVTLHNEFSILSSKFNVKFFAPAKNLCTDNAAMIAAAAYYNNNPLPWKDITANPELYYE